MMIQELHARTRTRDWSSCRTVSLLLILISPCCFAIFGGCSSQTVEDNNIVANAVLSVGMHHVKIALSNDERVDYSH